MNGADDAIMWVMAANIVVWLGISGYVAFIASCQSRLARRIKQMELLQNGHED